MLGLLDPQDDGNSAKRGRTIDIQMEAHAHGIIAFTKKRGTKTTNLRFFGKPGDCVLHTFLSPSGKMASLEEQVRLAVKQREDELRRQHEEDLKRTIAENEQLKLSNKQLKRSSKRLKRTVAEKDVTIAEQNGEIKHYQLNNSIEGLRDIHNPKQVQDQEEWRDTYHVPCRSPKGPSDYSASKVSACFTTNGTEDSEDCIKSIGSLYSG